MLTTQQGTGTFIMPGTVQPDDAERQRRLNQLVGEFAARAGREGFTVQDLIDRLVELQLETERRGR